MAQGVNCEAPRTAMHVGIVVLPQSKKVISTAGRVEACCVCFDAGTSVAPFTDGADTSAVGGIGAINRSLCMAEDAVVRRWGRKLFIASARPRAPRVRLPNILQFR